MPAPRPSPLIRKALRLLDLQRCVHRSARRERVHDRILSTWLAVGGLGLALAPWHAIEDGLLSPQAFAGFPWATASAPALFEIAGGHLFMLPLVTPLVAALPLLSPPHDTRRSHA